MDKFGNICIFDSGIGGITVLKEILKVLPNEKYIYYSDSKNNPYGDKSDEEIFKICDEIINYLLQRQCKAIVIACNTASCKVADKLREKYNQIPIIAIEPAYKMVYDYAYDKPTLVMATQGTIESERFHTLYNTYNNNQTYLLACKGLADLIEDSNQEELMKYIQNILSAYRGKVQNVVLGCTHYPLVKRNIEQVLGKVNFFYGAPNLARHLKDILSVNDLLNQNYNKLEIEFIDSSNSDKKRQRFFKLLT